MLEYHPNITEFLIKHQFAVEVKTITKNNNEIKIIVSYPDILLGEPQYGFTNIYKYKINKSNKPSDLYIITEIIGQNRKLQKVKIPPIAVGIFIYTHIVNTCDRYTYNKKLIVYKIDNKIVEQNLFWENLRKRLNLSFYDLEKGIMLLKYCALILSKGEVTQNILQEMEKNDISLNDCMTICKIDNPSIKVNIKDNIDNFHQKNKTKSKNILSFFRRSK